MGVSLSQLEASERACRVEPDGMLEYEILTAFDRLCKQQGGYKRGREKLLKIIDQQVN